MAIHPEVAVLGKVVAVALAVGLDVLALSVGVGVARLAPAASLRVGTAFAAAEIAMQVIGYGLGTGATQLLGQVAEDISIGLLFVIGLVMLIKSFEYLPDAQFAASNGLGLLLSSVASS